MSVKWLQVTSLELTKPFEAPWLMVVDVFEPANRISITAEGEWNAIPGFPMLCGPDGLSGLALSADALVLANCPVGALIGKFGGSSANLEEPAPAAAGTAAAPAAFAIGSRCLLAFSDTSRGPLYIGLNCRVRPVPLNSLKITISSANI